MLKKMIAEVAKIKGEAQQFFIKEDYSKAKEYYEKIIKLDIKQQTPELVSAHCMLGQIYTLEKKYAEAKQPPLAGEKGLRAVELRLS